LETVEVPSVDASDEESEPRDEDTEVDSEATGWIEQSIESLNALNLPQAALIKAVDKMINELHNIKQSKERVYRPHTWTRSQRASRAAANAKEFRATNANAVRNKESKPERPEWSLHLMRSDTIRTRSVRPRTGSCVCVGVCVACTEGSLSGYRFRS
jgi:hypothetical protein